MKKLFFLLLMGMTVSCSEKLVSGKAEAPALDCEAIDLKALKAIAGVEYTHASPKFREPDQCNFRAGISGNIMVSGIGGRDNLSDSNVANYGNAWTEDKGLAVNISPPKGVLSDVMVYGDFTQRQGISVSVSGFAMSKEEYGRMERESGEMKEKLPQIYEKNREVALYLVHQFHQAHEKGSPALVKKQPRPNPKATKAGSIEYDCDALDFSAAEKYLGVRFQVKTKKSAEECTVETSDGFSIQIRSDHHDRKQGFAVLFKRDAEWTHDDAFDRVISTPNEVPIRTGGIRFQNGNSVHMTVSVTQSVMLTYIQKMQNPEGQAEFAKKSEAVFAAVGTVMQSVLAN